MGCGRWCSAGGLVAAEGILPCLILRTSRFFPEADDRNDVRAAYEGVVSAHRLAPERSIRTSSKS